MRSTIAAILSALSLAGLAGCEIQAEPSAAAMLRYQVDPARQRSWWLTRDGVVLHSAAESKRTVPLPGWLWALAPLCPPDMALGPNGEAVVTTNVTSIVWRIDPRTLAVTVHPLELQSGSDIGFVALAYSAEQGSFFAYSEGPPAVWKIDRELARATKVANVDLGRTRCADLGHRLIRFTRLGG